MSGCVLAVASGHAMAFKCLRPEMHDYRIFVYFASIFARRSGQANSYVPIEFFGDPAQHVDNLESQLIWLWKDSPPSTLGADSPWWKLFNEKKTAKLCCKEKLTQEVTISLSPELKTSIGTGSVFLVKGEPRMITRKETGF